MPLTTIVTGMWGPKAQAYADIFLPPFDRYLAGRYNLQVWSDQRIDGAGDRQRWIGATDGWVDFMGRHRNDDEKAGRAVNRPRPWKDKEVAAGYNFKFDATRFAGQAFVPEAAAKELPDGAVLCWLDADVAALRDVPTGFIEKLLGDDDGAYLGRGEKHSEIGFWAVRLSGRTRAMLEGFADCYRGDCVFGMSEWHSAYVW